MNNYKVGAIKRSIEKWILENSTIEVDYSRWYCGITKYPDDTRLKQHMNKRNDSGYFFKIWNAETMQQANNVEAYFSDKGMQNFPHSAGAKKTSKYVYVYKPNHTVFDDFKLFFEEIFD